MLAFAISIYHRQSVETLPPPAVCCCCCKRKKVKDLCLCKNGTQQSASCQRAHSQSMKDRIDVTTKSPQDSESATETGLMSLCGDEQEEINPEAAGHPLPAKSV